MFKNMRLAAKIGVGFGLLLAIALVLGGLAVWSMRTVGDKSTMLADEYAPEVQIANDIQADAQTAMFEMRGYAYTEDKTFYDAGTKALAEAKKAIQQAVELAQKSPHLVKLKDAVDDIDANVAEYEKMSAATVTLNEAIQKDRQTLNESAAAYMKLCADFVASQNEQMTKDIAAGLEAAKLEERLNKITLVNDIIVLGDATRLAVWKAQAQRDAQAIQQAQANFDAIAAKLEELKKTTRQEINLKQIAGIRDAADNYKTGMKSLTTNMLALQDLMAKRVPLALKVKQDCEALAKAGIEQTLAIAEDAQKSLATASTVMLTGLGMAALVGVFLAVFITRSITKPINRVIDGLKAGAEQTASASNQVAQSSQQMAEGASQQASSLEEVSSSLEEMASMTRQNADNAGQANSMASQAAAAAEQGNAAMARMAEAINRIKTSSDQTAKIIKTIDEIAFQTNLLALNAAVEAARAGEAGKGFAVVAEEVRNLAQRSAEAAKNTSSLIEESQKNAENGVQVTDEVAKILSQIVTDVQKVNQLIGEVSTASKEQTQGIEQINTAVAQMDKVTQSNAANAEESASASEELSAQARELNEMVNALVAIVGGAGTARSAGQPQAGQPKAKPDRLDHALHEAWQTKSSQPTKKAAPAATTAKAASRPAKPQEVIPLDDAELKQF